MLFMDLPTGNNKKQVCYYILKIYVKDKSLAAEKNLI